MKKSDTRQWQYVEPLIKCDCNLIIKAYRDYYEHEMGRFRVQSIKINKKTGELDVTLKQPADKD